MKKKEIIILVVALAFVVVLVLWKKGVFTKKSGEVDEDTSGFSKKTLSPIYTGASVSSGFSKKTLSPIYTGGSASPVATGSALQTSVSGKFNVSGLSVANPNNGSEDGFPYSGTSARRVPDTGVFVEPSSISITNEKDKALWEK